MTEDRRVLLVEDDEGLRGIVARHLRALDFEVDEAPSAEDAGRALAGGLRPDVVILDLDLPGVTGWDLVGSAAMTAAGSPPVVIATATTMDPRRLAESGVAGYLSKPFPLETLVATIDRLAARPSEGSSPAGATEVRTGSRQA